MSQAPIDAQITFVYTRDLSRSTRFYEGVLGLELAVDQGSCRIYRAVGRVAYVGVCERADAPEPGGIILTLVTPDVEGWHERVVARGWECESEPRHNPTYQITHFFLRDPDGWLVEIQRFDRDDWDAAP